MGKKVFKFLPFLHDIDPARSRLDKRKYCIFTGAQIYRTRRLFSCDYLVRGKLLFVLLLNLVFISMGLEAAMICDIYKRFGSSSITLTRM